MRLKTIKETWGKFQLTDSGSLPDHLKRRYFVNDTFQIQRIQSVDKKHWLVTIDDRYFPQYFEKKTVEVIYDSCITPEIFNRSFPHGQKEKLDTYYPYFEKELFFHNINTPIRICAFFGQIAHQTRSLCDWEETGDCSKYEGRKDLGNVHPGDGELYKGRSPIRIRGLNEYYWASDKLGVDFVHNPEWLTHPVYGVKISCLWWEEFNLNELADLNTLSSYKMITRIINGGYTGWSDRVTCWLSAKKAFGLF